MTAALQILAAASKPAGGAALDQILIANAMAIVASGALLWLVLGHRYGRRPHLARAADFAERRSGMPGWVALPLGIAMVSLIVALMGMYWDIALHIDIGRDEGPLANPAHYLILGGLFGIFCAGFIAMALPRERVSDTSVRINAGWYAPLGGVLMVVTSGFALLGFPLDDFWHRLFGQDVTLWGPTHLMLIGGAGLTLIGMAVLMVEGVRSQGRDQTRQAGSWGGYFRRVSLMGGFLIGLSTFQAEFDFGVPQFQMIFQPIMLGVAAGMALVCARVWIGPGGALGAVAFFLALRGAISLVVGPVFGETTPALPLYLAEAGVVELAALWLASRPLSLGVASGLGIGTIGFAAEYGWTQVAYESPWNANLLPEGLIFATIAAVAGGLAGALMGTALRGELPAPRVARVAALASFAAVSGLVANGLAESVPNGYSADVRLTDVRSAPDREVSARVQVYPATAADDAKWLNITSWQGGGLVVNRLERLGGISTGIYRTTEPIPVHGDWKATLRLQQGRSVLGMPIYFPADPAIPAPGVAAPARIERPFIDDKQLLQREVKDDVPGWLTTLAPLVVLGIALSLMSALAFGLARLGRPGRPRDTERPGWKAPAVPKTTRPA